MRWRSLWVVWKEWVVLTGGGRAWTEPSGVRSFRNGHLQGQQRDMCMNGCEGMRVHWSEFVQLFYETDTFLPPSLPPSLPSFLPSFLPPFLPSSYFQLLPYPTEPGSIMLKMEAVYSSAVSEQACTTWFETPKNNHHLNHSQTCQVSSLCSWEIIVMSVNVVVVKANFCLYKPWRRMWEC